MYTKKELANGVRFFEIPMRSTKTCTVLVMVKTGSRNETRDISGISHFVEHMFFKGTKKRPNSMAISSALDSVGGEFNAFTSKEYTGYYAKVDARHVHVAVDVIADIVLHSTFKQSEIAREKGVIIEEINMYESNPLIHIDDVFERCLYGDTPAGWDTIGTKATVQSFQRKDFVDYYRSQYRGSSIVVGVAGSFTARNSSIAQKLFSQLPAGEGGTAYRFESSQSVPCVHIEQCDTHQASLSLGVPAYSYHHDDYVGTQLLATVLGGPMSSRLFTEVREKRGLAYQVHTHVEGYHDSGYLTTTIGTAPQRLEEVVITTMKEYRKICNRTVTARELQKAKEYIRGKMLLALESSEAVANWYIKREILGLPLYSPEQFIKKFQKVTASDIRRIAQAIFQANRFRLAVISPSASKTKLQKCIR